MAQDEKASIHHVVIVGGGIAGLSAAYYLQKLAPELAVTLLEASARLGGKIRSEFVDGRGDRPFVLEAGADAFLAKQKPWAYELALELGLADRILPTNDDNAGVYLVDGVKLLRLPPGLQLIVPTDWEAFARSPLLSAAGKARLAQEAEIPARPDPGDESVAEFVTRRLGAEALEKLGEPLLSGIYSARPEEQSILATFPRFRQMEQRHGSLLAAVAAGKQSSRASQRRKEGTQGSYPPPPSAFISFIGGTDELPKVLADQLQAEVRLHSAVERIECNGAGYRLRLGDGGTLAADALVLAIPARPAAALLRPLVPAAATTLDQLRTVSSGVVWLAYERDDVPHPLDAFGVVVPRAEERDCNALTFTSSKFDRRAPEGYALIRYFFGGARTPHLMEANDAAIVATAQREVQALLGVAAAPCFHRVVRWWDAQPQYDVGHLARMAAIHATLPPTVQLIGTAYGGVGIPDCVRQGKEAATRILRARHKDPSRAATES